MQYLRTPIIAAVLSGGDSQRIFFLPLLGGWCWCHWLVVKSHFFFPSRHQPANPSSPQLFLSSGMRRGRLACNFHLPLFPLLPLFADDLFFLFFPGVTFFSGDSNFGGIGWPWEKDVETDTFLQQSNPFLWARKIAPPTAIGGRGRKNARFISLFLIPRSFIPIALRISRDRLCTGIGKTHFGFFSILIPCSPQGLFFLRN